MAILLDVASRQYNADTRELGPVSVPVGLTQLRVTLTREAWPLTNQDILVQIGIEMSLDGGVTWPYGAFNYDPSTGNGGWVGGERTSALHGSITQEHLQRGDLPDPTNPNRRARAVAINTATFRTAILLEAF